MATYSKIRQARERAGRSSRQPGYRPPRPTRNQLAGAVTSLRPNLRPNLRTGTVGKLGGAIRPFFPNVREIGGAVETFGNVIGGPRAGIVSALKEGIDLVQDVAGLTRGRGWGGESSWDDYWRQSTSNYGFGDLVHDEKATVGWGLTAMSPFTLGTSGVLGASLLADRYFDYDPMGDWNDRIIGLIGDIALDPLTYVGGANIMVRGMGYKGAGTMLSRLKTLSKNDLGLLLNRGKFSGVNRAGATKAIDDAIKLANDGRSLGTIQRSLQQTNAGRAVARATGLEPGVRLRLPGTGGVGRAFGNTPAGQRLGSVIDRVPFADQWRGSLLTQRLRNAPEALTFGLDDSAMRGAVQTITRGRVAARKALKARGEMPAPGRLLARRGAVSREADLIARRALRGTDPRLAKVAGQVARAHVEVAVPGIARAGAGGAKIAEALSKIPGRGGMPQPVLGGRLFGRADFPLTIWRNLPGPGGMTGALGKAARMWQYVGDETAEKLQTILSPKGWQRTYADNPGLAQDVQKGVTKFYRNSLSVNDRVFADLLRSGDPNQIVRAWQSEQSVRYARGQVSFFREVTRRLTSRLATETRKLAKRGLTERGLGRWMRAALQRDVLVIIDDKIVGINRNSRWFKNLPADVQNLTDEELVAIAKTTTESMGDSSRILRNAFGEPNAKGESIWVEEQSLQSEEGFGYFPRRLTDDAKELFDIKVYDTNGTDLSRDAFEGGYKTAQSMRQRSWKPGGSIKLTDKGAAAANQKFVYRDSSGQAWLATGVPSTKGNPVKFKIKHPNSAAMSVQDQIDDVAEVAFGKPIFEGPMATLKSYAGGMGMQLGGESMMSHLKYTVGLDDMFRFDPDVAQRMRRVGGTAVEGVEDSAQMSLFDVPVGKPVWDKYTRTNRAALDRALAKVRARTRSLYASSKAKFNEVVEVNERLGRAVGPEEAAGPERLAFQGMEDINVNMVRNFGEMEGITEEMAYIGARLNQIFTDNSDTIANGTYKVPEEVRDLIVRAHDLAARAFAISDGVGSMAVSQKEFMETLLDTLDDTDLADITDLFNSMARGVRRSMAYLSGEQGYVGQFPLTVQQGKELMVNDKSIDDLIDLAEWLDPERAQLLRDVAERAGTVVQGADAPAKYKDWAEGYRTARKIFKDFDHEEFISYGITQEVPNPQELLAAIDEDIVGLTGYARMWESIQALRGGDVGDRLIDRLTPGRLMGEAQYTPSAPTAAQPSWAEAGATIEDASKGGTFFHAGDVREETLVARAELHVGSWGAATERIGIPSKGNLRGESRVHEVTVTPRKPYFPGGPDDPFGQVTDAPHLLDERTADSWLLYRIVNGGTDANGDSMIDVLLEAGYDTIPYLNTTEAPGSLSYMILDPASVRVGPSTTKVRKVGEYISEGHRFFQNVEVANMDVTPPAVLEAATAARDDARLLFDEAAAMRAEIAEIDARLAGIDPSGTGRRQLLRNDRARRTLLKDAALAAELSAQSRAREAAELLDVTRAEREMLKLEDFISKSDMDLQDLLSPDKPFADRQATMDAFVDMVADGMPNFGPWRMASGNTDLDANMVAAAKAYNRLLQLKDPKVLRPVLKRFDQIQNWFKAGVIATPGFVYRNLFGAFFNAYLDGVDLNQIWLALQAKRRIDSKAKADDISFLQAARELKVVDGKSDEYMEDLVTLLERGVRGGGQTTREASPFAAPVAQGDIPWYARGKRAMERGVTVGTGRQARSLGTVLPFGPGSSNFMFNRVIRGMNSNVEDVVRMGVGMDTMRWGGTADDALDRVARSQFDYGELTGFEQGAMRRAVPFYVWTRKNVPYQFSKLASNPAAYNRAMAVKKNMEYGTEDRGLVPDWFVEPFGIRTPWSYVGARIYAVPDMPFLDLYRYDPTRTMEGDPFFGINETWKNLLWQGTPIVKTPLEALFGQQMATGYAFKGDWQRMPAVLENTLGLVPGLDNLGVTRIRGGKREIQDHMLYFIMNTLPQLSVARRLVPSEERYQRRLFETLFSTMLGLGLQRQTPDVKERWRNRLEYQLREAERNEPSGGLKSGGGFG